MNPYVLSIGMHIGIAQQEAERTERAALAKRAVNHMDAAAFEILYQETAGKLAAYLRRAVSDAALADDIFQEAFLRFLRTCPPGLGERQQRAYLYRTATSLLVDHWRRARRERIWGLKTLFENRAPGKQDLGQDVARLFARLKPQEQALLWMAYVEGFDHREIAAALELNQRSVRVLLYRARKKLAGILAGAGLVPPGVLRGAQESRGKK